MAEFDAGTARYQSSRLDVFKQQSIVRRLAPFLALFATSMGEAEKNPRGLLVPLAEIVSKMSDDDIEYVQKTCLRVVQRQQGKIWVKVLASNDALMFEDIGLLELNTIVFEVLQDNLANFFSGFVQSGFAPAATQSS